MRLLVTGREGQVVMSLIERARELPDVEVVAAGRPELDLANPPSIRPIIERIKPDVVVSAAAYTAVDQAEDEPDTAFAINGAGAGAVSEAAANVGAPVIHLSTDYVFSGDGESAYLETDPTGPVSVYGKSKLEGERLVAAANPRHVILRTAWVYSPFGKNFVKTMLNAARTRDHLRVVSDQWGNPTSALDIADGVLAVASALHKEADEFGVFHMVGTGDINWSGFAEEIFAASRKHGGPSATIEAISTSEYPTKAVRPKNSRLSCQRLKDIYGVQLPEWRTSTDETVARLLA